MCRATTNEEALECAKEAWESRRRDIDLLRRGMSDDLTISEKRELYEDYDYSSAKKATDAEIDEIIDDEWCYERFAEYGLALDVVEPCTFKNQPDRYMRYQFSWGGPAEEIRFYFDCGATYPNYIEFWFLDWGVGNGIDISDDSVAQWLWDYFSEIMYEDIQNCTDSCEEYFNCDREYIPDECLPEEEEGW